MAKDRWKYVVVCVLLGSSLALKYHYHDLDWLGCVLGIVCVAVTGYSWWSHMRANSTLKRIRDAIWPQTLTEGSFISKSLSREIQSIMPGETMNITVNGRQFVIVERDEFEVILAKGGFVETRSANSTTDK